MTQAEQPKPHPFTAHMTTSGCRLCNRIAADPIHVGEPISRSVQRRMPEQPSSDDPRVNWGAEWYERDDQPTQPSRSEGAELDTDAKFIAMMRHQAHGGFVGPAREVVRLLGIVDGQADALRQDQAQTEQEKYYALPTSDFPEGYTYKQGVLDLGREVDELRAELAAANEQRAHLAADVSAFSFQHTLLEEQVRERDQTIADLTAQDEHHNQLATTYFKNLTDALLREDQLRASLEAAKTNEKLEEKEKASDSI